ncbi:MAG: rRNA maturation RNase YbeY, partial [Chlamydiia bacterium]|nr:rRNA maturation RNase YbeY [Chlamydiia bacterium]
PNVDEGGSHLLGELFVCPGVALDHAQTHQCDPYEEVSLYIIHALLHLLGFRDQTDEERSVMRGEEKSAIDYLKKHEQLLHH